MAIFSAKDVKHHILFFKKTDGTFGFQLELGDTELTKGEQHLLLAVTADIFDRADRQEATNKMLNELFNT